VIFVILAHLFPEGPRIRVPLHEKYYIDGREFMLFFQAQPKESDMQGNRSTITPGGGSNRYFPVLMGLMTILMVIAVLPAYALPDLPVPAEYCISQPEVPYRYNYNHEATGWMGVAVVCRYNVNLFVEAWSGPTDQSLLLNSSEIPAGDAAEMNFLVHKWESGNGPGYFKATTDAYQNVEHMVGYDPGHGTLPFDTEYSGQYGSMDECGLFRVWNLTLEAGNSYVLNLDSDAESGHLEIRAALLLTGGNNDWLARTDALWEVAARDDPENAGYSFSVPTTGTYGLVVFRNGAYNLDVFDSTYHLTVEDNGLSTNYADLSIHSILPDTAASGQAFNLDITVRNSSSTTASDPCFTSAQVDGSPQCVNIPTPAIAPQGVVHITTCSVGPIPAGTPSISVTAQVDVSNVVAESDELNNGISKTINIVSPMPNLIVYSITPNEVIPHQQVTFQIKVKNIGGADAGASETTFNIAGTNHCGLLATLPLAPGATDIVTCHVSGMMPGTHAIGAWADVGLAVPESDEYNYFSSSVVCRGAELEIASFTPEEVTNSDQFQFEFLVQNNGNLDSPVSNYSISSNGSPLITLATLPVIPQGEEVLITTDWIDPLPIGTAHITICVDPDNNVPEYYEDNNCIEGDVEVIVNSATVFPDGHGQFPTIQTAVDAMAPGGTISLAYGVFTGPGNRDISFGGKDVTVQGTGRYDPGRCTIDCEGSSGNAHRAFIFEDGESSEATLTNFLIKNAWTAEDGGAIRIDGTHPTLDNLIFRNNVSYLNHGGAIYANSNFQLDDCLFENNSATGEWPETIARGGAVYCSVNGFSIQMDQNTFVNNHADEGSAIYIGSSGGAVVNIGNSLFAENSSVEGTVDGSASATIDLECCDIWGNSGGDWIGIISGQNGSEGNISADPLFCDYSSDVFTLHADSPCAEENAPGCGQIGALGVDCAPSGQEIYSVLADGSGDYATIQAAIDTAHDGDLVELGDGVYSGMGNRDLHFDGTNLTVRSQSGNAENCIIDCGGSSGDYHSAFRFYNSGESSSASIEDITMRYGYHSQGGAVSVIGASPSFYRCVFYVNQAQNSGGAVYGQNAYSRFVDCEFIMNHTEGSGAGLCLTSGSYGVDNCLFSGNSAAVNGGGIQLEGCEDSRVEYCTLVGNTATGDGGALDLNSAQVTITSCTMDENHAGQGGGISADAATMIQMSNTNITQSYSSEGFFCEQSTYIMISCSNIWGNQDGDWVGYIAGLAGDDGNLSVDPIYCNPGLGDWQLDLLSPVNADNNPCGQVGPNGIGCGIQTFVVLPDGTGDYPTIQDALNACAWGDTVSLVNGVYTGDGNRDLHFDGTAATLKSESGNPALCIIDCNASAVYPHRGFNFTAVDGPNVRLEGITVRNAWKNYGGAIRLSGGHPAIENCIFEDNTSNNGAGIAAAQGAGPAISDCIFRNNTATDAGGGINVSQSADPSLINCTFTGNTAIYAGGGVYVYGPSAPTFENCLFKNNGSNSWGGAFHTQMAGADPVFISCTFYANYAPLGGVGFCRNSSHPDVSNSILSDSPTGMAIYCNTGGMATLTCCDVWGNAGGDWVGGISGQGGVNGNISLDPGYCDPTSDLFTLASGSPCLPSGNDCDVTIGMFGLGCSGGEVILQVNADGSGDYPTIQAAVDAAYHGDTVQLSDGVFTGAGNYHVNLNGKQIRVCSESGNALACIIDCEASESVARRAFKINSNEGPDTIIENLTIANGYIANGAGIQINNASPTITGCRFVNNDASSNGGGIYVGGTQTPYINNCFFDGNTAGNAGAGIIVMGTGCIVEGCSFRYNYGYYGGGGIYIYQTTASVVGCLFEDNTCNSLGSDLEINAPDKEVTVVGCTFVDGTSPDGVIRVRNGSTPEFSYCLIAFSQHGEAISCDGGSVIDISCSDIFGNQGGDWVGCLSGLDGTDGNFSSDPLFCHAETSDYGLSDISPCLPNGNNCAQQIGAFGEACAGGVSSVEEQLPKSVLLSQNYPNPFNPSTTIRFSLPRTMQASLKIYNVQGRLVKTLLQDNPLEPGLHQAVWRGRDNRGRPAGSGVYWYMLRTEDGKESRKMMLLE
jgi:parallel beta-helix repeat protein/predicted outer membrane repeat protein